MKANGVYMKPNKRIDAKAKPAQMQPAKKTEIPKTLYGVHNVETKTKAQSLTWKSLIIGVLSLVVYTVIKMFVPDLFQEPLMKAIEYVLQLILGSSALTMLWGIRRANGDVK